MWDEADFAVLSLNGYPNSMKQELSNNLIWSLQALAQPPIAQRELYPKFAVVPDELVLDFYHTYSEYKNFTGTKHDDLDILDALIASKSGILEFWTDEALDRSEFWFEIRTKAKTALEVRHLPAHAPHPSPDTYATETEVWKAGQTDEISIDDTPASLVSRLQKRFR